MGLIENDCGTGDQPPWRAAVGGGRGAAEGVGRHPTAMCVAMGATREVSIPCVYPVGKTYAIGFVHHHISVTVCFNRRSGLCRSCKWGKYILLSNLGLKKMHGIRSPMDGNHYAPLCSD